MKRLTTEMTKKTGMSPGEPEQLAELAEYADDAVVSRTLTKGSGGTLTVFAFDAGQGLSEHTTPFDAWVMALQGSATVTIGPSEIPFSTGSLLLMPANVPHAISTTERFKMLLVMLKQEPTSEPDE